MIAFFVCFGCFGLPLVVMFACYFYYGRKHGEYEERMREESAF